MVLDVVENTTRSKRKFKLSQEEFFEGKWLDDLKHMMPFKKIDVVYKGGYLIASFYDKQIREVIDNDKR